MTNSLTRLDERCFPSSNTFKCSATYVAPETMGMVQLG